MVASSLKVKVESSHNGAAPHRIGDVENLRAAAVSAQGDEAVGSHSGIFVVPGETRAAEHDGVPAVARGVGGYVAIAIWEADIHKGLLRNIDFFKAPEEHHLGADVVVAFEEDAHERRGLGAKGQRGSRGSAGAKIR